MLRRTLQITLATLIIAATALTTTPAANAEPTQPPPERHTISVGAPATKKNDRKRAAATTKSATTKSANTVAPLAGSVTPVGTADLDAAQLALAMVANPDTLQYGRYLTTPPTWGTNGVATGLGYNGNGALLTNGDSTLAPQPNEYTSSGRDSGGGKVRGDSAYDVTILELRLQAPSWATCMKLNFRYYSEEFPEWVRSAYNDGFVAELDKTTWITRESTILAPDNFAFDPSGNVISTNTTGALVMTEVSAAGTTYNGATPELVAGTPIEPGAHSLYLSIFDQHDAVYDSATLINNLRFTDDTPAQCGTGAKPLRRPIVFVPGILGSKLEDATGKELWPALANLIPTAGRGRLMETQLNPDGTTDALGNGVQASDVLTGPGGYNSAIKLIQDAGYVRGEDIDNPQPGESFWTAAADWRKSANYNAQKLLDRIEGIRTATGADKVNIVAHSQGGLVVQAAMHQQRSIGQVNRISTIATPYLGAAKALGVLHYRKPCVIPYTENRCMISKAVAATITENFPGFLELLPSDAYHDAVEPPIYRFWNNDGALTPTQVRNSLAEHNLPLIDDARAWHNTVDKWFTADPKVGLTRLTGTGYATATGFNEYGEQQCNAHDQWWLGCTHGKSARIRWGDGDGTVPSGSAELPTALRGNSVNLPPFYYEHTPLPNKTEVMASALHAVEGEGSTTGTLTTAPQQTAAAANNVSATELLVDGAQGVLLTDSSGNRTGEIDGEIEAEDIPGSTYVSDENDKHITVLLTQARPASVRIETPEAGYIHVRIRHYVNGQITSTFAYPPIQAFSGLHYTVGATGLTYPPTRVNVVRSDGLHQVEPLPTLTGGAAADVITPKTTVKITYSDDTPRRATITLSATDGGGAGVERIEYAVDPEQFPGRPQTGVYEGPFLTWNEGTWPGMKLYVRAIDKAGNVEDDYHEIPVYP